MDNCEEIVYLPLGGAGEIGANCYLYGFGSQNSDREWIMVDCGMGFGSAEETPGIDVFYPDLGFIRKRKKHLKAVFLTHGHEDHIGAIVHFCNDFKVPIYSSSFVISLIRRKLKEASIKATNVQLCEIEPGQFVDLSFGRCAFVSMKHSIPYTNALLIKTQAGVVFHSADFKLSYADRDELQDTLGTLIGDDKVICLTCDSTNVIEEGISESEDIVKPALHDIMKECTGAVAVTCFASNIERLKAIVDVASDCGRRVVIVGRAIQRMVEIAVGQYEIVEFPEVISDVEARNLPRENLCYLVTGSQGEGNAAFSRISTGNHPMVKLKEGDTAIFSSKVIPGNERAVHKVWNNLAKQGVHIVDGKHATIHVTGHAHKGDLKLLYDILSPEMIVPMHGEYRHLVEHMCYAKEQGFDKSCLVENGAILRIWHVNANNKKIGSVLEKVQVGRVYVDGALCSKELDSAVEERIAMSKRGHLTVTLVLDENEYELICEPGISSIGVPSLSLGGSVKKMQDSLLDAVERAFDDAMSSDTCDNEVLKEIERCVVKSVSSFYQKFWKKKPVISVNIVMVNIE